MEPHPLKDWACLCKDDTASARAVVRLLQGPWRSVAPPGACLWPWRACQQSPALTRVQCVGCVLWVRQAASVSQQGRYDARPSLLAGKACVYVRTGPSHVKEDGSQSTPRSLNS